MNGKKYRIILADPPWSFKYYGKSDDKYRRAEGHYDVMDLADIKKLPVGKLADKDCALFIWAISPMLPQAIEVIESWGFTFKTVAFTWIKKNQTGQIFFGLGYWTRANAEFCLLATKGSPKRASSDVSQVVITKKRQHSRKPDEVRELIVKLMGDVPRIELFARQRFEGWDVWGKEAPKQIQKILRE